MINFKVINFEKQDLYLVAVIEAANSFNILDIENYFKNELNGYRDNFEFYMRFKKGLVHNIKMKREGNYIFLYFKTIPIYHDMCIFEMESYFNLSKIQYNK